MTSLDGAEVDVKVVVDVESFFGRPEFNHFVLRLVVKDHDFQLLVLL